MIRTCNLITLFWGEYGSLWRAIIYPAVCWLFDHSYSNSEVKAAGFFLFHLNSEEHSEQHTSEVPTSHQKKYSGFFNLAISKFFCWGIHTYKLGITILI